MSNDNIFVNCPFDETYRPCFEAILFTITMSGYQVRCALEDSDSGDVRFDKLCELIRASDHSVHDLSRTSSNPEGMPRFNMPFELGLMMGAKRFGTKRQKEKRAVIMVAEHYVMPRFLSDLAGNDPGVHDNNPKKVIRIIRDHLHTSSEGQSLPGAAFMSDLLDEFRSDLPALASAAKLTLDEAHPYRGYRNYMDLARSFRDTVGEIAN